MTKPGYKLLAALLFLLAGYAVQAQDPFAGGHFWVSFTDKNNSPFSISQPQEFLSQRSMDRRISQGIPVTLQDLPPNPAYIDSLKADADVEVWYLSRWFNGALIYSREESSMQRIQNLPFVADVEHVKPLPPDLPSKEEKPEEYLIRKIQPSSAQTSGQLLQVNDIKEKRVAAIWERLYSGQDLGLSSATIEQINGKGLITDGYLGQGKVIAVLDAGFFAADRLTAFSHLWNTGNIKGTRDFVEPQQNIFGSSAHGTYVLSVMAARRPGELMGTAVEASYWLIRTEESANEYRIEEYNWLAGAELADSLGADVINSSLGYTRFDDPDQDYIFSQLDGQTTVVARAANYAFERGILVVNSAGNYAQQNWRYIGSPADSYGALSVGAVDITGERAAFSSFGPSADGRIKPDIMAHGRQVPVVNTSEGVGLANGTSFSSPVIAGMAAALWQKHPEANSQQIKRAIIESGHSFFYPDTAFGHGIPDFARASRLLQNNFQPEKNLVLFPNPIKPDSFVSFFAENEQQVRIEIFDLKGQMVFLIDGYQSHQGYNRMQPFQNIYTLDNGVYILRLVIQSSGNYSVNKFIKAW